MGRRSGAARGFTLVEVAIAAAIVGILATAAWPSWRGQLLRSHRVEASTALQRLQAMQARHYARFGRYAGRLDELPGAGAGLGHYRLSLSAPGPDGYRAVAAAVGAQADDRACAEIELRVRGAVSVQLPSARCWLP